ncbi:MAG: choice-of-anchor B family protein [Rhodothermia bacterium]|nr:MAG: choice-of-anchor B family protein [Rhodothermia bacterium]
MKRIVAALAILPLFIPSSIARQYAPQFGADVELQGDEVFIADGRNRIVAGSVHVYLISEDGTWTEGSEIRASDAGETADGFGQAIDVSGDDLVIGAPVGNAVYVYHRTDDVWLEGAKLTGDGPGYGASVAVDGNHILVGTQGDREVAGRVDHYHLNNSGEWVSTGELSAEGIEARSGFGTILALQGNVAAVGSPGTDARKGAVHTYLFSEANMVWKSVGVLTDESGQNGHQFGASVLVIGPYLGIGAPGANRGIGKVHIYKMDEETGEWESGGRLAPFSAGGSDQFGSALAFDGSSIWVGAAGYGEREGAVFQFRTTGEQVTGTWRLDVEGLQFRSGFGGDIAVNDRVAVVGAVGQDNFEGAGFIFTNSEDGWAQKGFITNDFGKFDSVTGGMVECEDETAGAFTCSDVNMTAFLSTTDIGAKRGIQVNDVWGWEDPETGDEYALFGRTDGTSFINLSDPYNPLYLGNLPLTSTANPSLWRDIKVYKDHAFIVADGAGAHHMQIFDLTQLRDVQYPPVTFTETAIYKGVFSSHNIIINEDTGYAFAVGSDSGGETCGGALHMINIQDPVNPIFAGCFADTRTGRGSGSTHDAQCVTYRGPDTDYTGREICLSSNGNALSIADVTEKDNPVAISLGEYPNVAYTHQGWLTEDHAYFYLNDEGDEASGLVDATRTLIFDLADLDEPELVGEYYADNNAIDHNLYVKDNIMYQTNYQAGLRILDISDPKTPVEIGYFDTVPYGENNSAGVLGAWSNYPFFKSGVIVVTSGREGVFFLKKKDVDI